MPRRSLFIALALFLFVSLVPPADAEARSAADVQSAIDHYLTRWHETGQFNGSALIAKDGQVIFKKGYGLANREWNIPNRPDTRFKIYSISKQFTTVLVFQLAAEGKIDLDAKLTDYLPDYRKDTGSQVTIDHLLRNVSGIPCYINDPGRRKEGVPRYSWHVQYERDSFARDYLSGDLMFEPGSRYRYSNTDFHLLALVIEAVTGSSYEENLQQRILDPLGMKDSGIDSNERIIANRAEGYEKAPGGWIRMRPINPDNLLGAGNLYSTVEDLALWNVALEGDRLLPREWREKMFTVHLKEPHEEHAYTVNYFTRPLESGGELRYTGFSGGSTGFNTDAFRFPSAGLLVVLFDNSTQYNHWRIAPAIHDIATGSASKPVLPRPLASDALAQMVADKGVAAAVEQFEKIRSDPGGEYAIGATEREINVLGYSALRLKDFDLALDVFKLNVELFPDSWNAHDSLGEAYLAAGETELGKQAYARSREIRDREGIIMDLVARGEFAAAAAAIEHAREGSPGTPFLAPGRIGPLFEKKLMAGDHADALEICRVWAMANPGTAGPLFSMARVYTVQGDTDRAKAAYRKILEIQPEGRSAEVARERLEEMEQ